MPKILDVIEAPGEGTPAERDHTTALAIRAVGRIAPREYVVINALAVRLGRTTDLPPATRLALIEVLGQAGPSARAALPRLNVELTNASAQFQYAALQAIGSIEAIDPPSLGDLLEKLPTRLPASRLPAELVTIRKAGGEARALVPDLVKVAASDSPKYLQCWALEALAAAGSNDLRAFELALKQAASEDAFVSQLATQVLARIELKAEQAVPVLSQSLSHSNVSIRLSCAAAVKRFGPAAAAATGSLIRALERCGAQSSEDEIGAYLEALKSIGPAAASAGETIVALLDERAPIFQDRAKYQVHHLRGFMLATLAEIGVPKSAWPHILDSLANTGRRSAYVFAAGARAAAQLGPAAKAALPYLLKPMTREISDNVLTFETYSSHQSSTREYTNCLIESIRALARMGGEARSALPFLQELSKPDPFARDNPNRLMRLPNVAEEARNAIKAIES